MSASMLDWLERQGFVVMPIHDSRGLEIVGVDVQWGAGRALASTPVPKQIRDYVQHNQAVLVAAIAATVDRLRAVAPTPPPPPDPPPQPPPVWTYKPPVHDPKARLTLQQRFELFHDANPWVYEALVDMTWGLVKRGRLRVGIGMLYEALRWQYMLRTEDPTSEFKLNNDYRSRYARLIEEREPDLAAMNKGKGVYEKRLLTAI